MNNAPTSQVLKEMAHLTAMSGRINEVQIKNLEMYPLVFFNTGKEIKVDYDLRPVSLKDERLTLDKPYVSYSLEIDESQNSNLDKRFEALEKAVRQLFWSDVEVRVYSNNKILYISPKE